MSEPKNPTMRPLPENAEQADTTPRVGRLSTDESDVRQWAFQARAMWGVPVRVYERSLRAGGVDQAVWVAVIWAKGTAK